MPSTGYATSKRRVDRCHSLTETLMFAFFSRQWTLLAGSVIAVSMVGGCKSSKSADSTEPAKKVEAAKVDDEVAEEAGPASLKGKPAPAFDLKELGGKQVALDDMKGKVVLIDFWATWCPPCVKSLPHVNELAGNKDMAEKGLVVLAVNAREQDEKIQKFLNDKGLKNLIVPIDTDGATMSKYLVQGIPTTVIINRDGTVAEAFVGSGNDAAIDASIAKALAVESSQGKAKSN